ncbi:MAG: PIN domain-containing protein [Acidobacteriota bacterium]
MIVLVDTDVLLDLALDRAPHATSAGALIDLLQRRPGTALVAWHTISNFYYLVAPKRGRADTRAFLSDLTRFAEVAPTTTESLALACRLEMKDFEDAMLVAAAMAGGADVIATRNVRDHVNSPVRAASPASLLTGLG